MQYNSTEYGGVIYWITFVFLILGMLLLLLIPELGTILIALIMGCILVISLFYKMRIEVNNKELIIGLGIELFQKKIPLDQIVACQLVTIDDYDAWGIRYFPNYTLYKLRGKQGVKITVKHKERSFVVGTPRAEEVYQIIKRSIDLPSQIPMLQNFE